MAAPSGMLTALALFAALGLCACDDFFQDNADILRGEAKGLRSWSAQRRLLQNPVPERSFVGENATCGRYPYMVSLRDDNGVHLCGGVLIRPRWVMTAAHCVDSISLLGPDPVIVVGACKLSDDVKGVKPKKTFIHPAWTGKFGDGADIALLQLKKPSTAVQPKLPSERTRLDDQSLVAIGWGILPNGSTTEQLQQATDLDPQTDKFCFSEWGNNFNDSMFCAKGFGNAEVACGGDSGAPVLRAKGSRGDVDNGLPEDDIVVGITSFGEKGAPCGDDMKPGVYTRVSSFLSWIDDPQEDAQDDSFPPLGLVDPPLESVDSSLEPVDPPLESVGSSLEPVDPPLESVDPSLGLEDPSLEPVDPPLESVNPSLEPVDSPLEQADPFSEPVDPLLELVDPPMEPVESCSENIMWSFDYAGNDLSRSIYRNGPDNLQRSVEACCASCVDVEECKAFTWNLNNGECWLKFCAGNLRQIFVGATKIVRKDAHC